MIKENFDKAKKIQSRIKQLTTLSKQVGLENNRFEISIYEHGYSNLDSEDELAKILCKEIKKYCELNIPILQKEFDNI